MSTREDLLGTYKAAAARTLGPVEATFMSVAGRFAELGLVAQMDEETVTAAFLGGIASTFPYCVLAFGSGTENAAPCSWGQFRKATGPVITKDSEAYRGADFALVFSVDKSQCRLALFQAKKANAVDDDGEEDDQLGGAKVEGQCLIDESATDDGHADPVPVLALLDIHRRRRRKKAEPLNLWRPAQTVQLLKTGVEITLAQLFHDLGKKSWKNMAEDAVRGPNAVVDLLHETRKDLHWIHYLAYVDNDARVVAMSELPQDNVDKEFLNRSFKSNAVSLDEVEHGSFVATLTRGIDSSHFPEKAPCSDRAGWITVHPDVVAAILPKLQELMPVYVGDERGTIGPVLRREMERQMEAGTFKGVGFTAPPSSAPVLTRQLKATRQPTPGS